MFRVEVDSLQAYLDFDAARKPELIRLHALMRKAAPDLTRYFHKGNAAGRARHALQDDRLREVSLRRPVGHDG